MKCGGDLANWVESGCDRGIRNKCSDDKSCRKFGFYSVSETPWQDLSIIVTVGYYMYKKENNNYRYFQMLIDLV